MVIDASALVAVLTNEPERLLFVSKPDGADSLMLSAANLMEARMVLYRRNPAFLEHLDSLLFRFQVRIEPVTVSQSDIAFDAFRRFGKGSGHKAGLNFGDCFAYAVARERGAALLFKGDDFAHTDITPA